MIVPVHEIRIPGGEVKYQCTRCWGVYNSKAQAETIGFPGTGKPAHRCRAGPFRESGFTVSNRKPEKWK